MKETEYTVLEESSLISSMKENKYEAKDICNLQYLYSGHEHVTDTR